MAMNFKLNILPILNKSEAKWKKIAKRIKFLKLSKKAIWGLAIGLGIPVYLIGLIIIAWYPVADNALAYAKGSAASVQVAQKHMTEQKFRTALADLADVSANLEGLRVSLSIIPKSARNLPIIKTQIDAVEFTVDSSSQLISAMRTLTILANDILDPFLKNSKLSLDELPENVRREILKGIFESPPILQGSRPNWIGRCGSVANSGRRRLKHCPGKDRSIARKIAANCRGGGLGYSFGRDFAVAFRLSCSENLFIFTAKQYGIAADRRIFGRLRNYAS